MACTMGTVWWRQTACCKLGKWKYHLETLHFSDTASCMLWKQFSLASPRPLSWLLLPFSFKWTHNSISRIQLELILLLNKLHLGADSLEPEEKMHLCFCCDQCRSAKQKPISFRRPEPQLGWRMEEAFTLKVHRKWRKWAIPKRSGSRGHLQILPSSARTVPGQGASWSSQARPAISPAQTLTSPHCLGPETEEANLVLSRIACLFRREDKHRKNWSCYIPYVPLSASHDE